MLNVIITFDYEIFFGRNNFTEKEILFDPTDKILVLLEKYGLCGVFFADVLSVDAYARKNPENDYPKKFENQIRKMIRSGHDVQLHIHPHWITARYNKNDGQWEIDPYTYRIHHFLENKDSEKSAEDIIKDSIAYLNDTLKLVDNLYECYAYRAGGYCIQPEWELFYLLARYGIEIDSSVCIGKRLHSEAHYFDFDRDYEELNWIAEAGIMELPIGSVRNSLVRRMIPRSGFRTLDKEPAKGEGIAGTTKPAKGKIARLLNYNRTRREFGLEFMHHKQMMYGLRQYYKKYNCENTDQYVAVICHPKSMDRRSMENMKVFISNIQDNYNWVRFATLKEMRKAIRKDT